MLSIVGRHWRGETGFWLGVLGCTLLVPALIGVLVLYVLGVLTVDHAPRARMFETVIGFGFIGLIVVWQLVGTWRGSAKSRPVRRSFVARWFARVLAGGVAALGGVALATIPKGLAQLKALADGTDPIGSGGYSVTVQGGALIYTGYFAWPALVAIETALAGAPQVKTVILNSPGGIVPVGTRFAAIVKTRGFDTLVNSECSSACTYVFLAGQRRVLQGRGRLGFHSVANVFGADTTASASAQRHAEALLAARGVPADFIARVSSTPASSMWYPAPEELRRAGVATEFMR